MEFWKLNLKEIGVLENNWELKFWKLNFKIEVLEIKFEINWKFEIIWELNLRIEVLKN